VVSRERSIIVLISLIVLAITALPYILGYALAPADMEFSGLVMNIEDSQSYLAKMLQGYQGRWLYYIPFTPEEHEGAFVGGFYLFWGWVARLLGLPIIYLWHISRILCGALLLLVIYLFITRFLEDPSERIFAFLLSVLGSGFGWALLLTGRPFLWGSFPVDFKMPEAHPFFTILTFPHFSFATAMLLVIPLLLLEYLRRGDLLWSGLAGIAALLLAIAQPFNVAIVAAVFLAYLALLLLLKRLPSRRKFLGLLPLGLIPLPLVIHYYFVFTTNPVFRSWWEQASTPSPHPLHYLLAYGPFLLAVPGIMALIREKGEGLLLVAWAVVIPPLLYLPLNPQRRFVEGLHIPLSILATIGVYRYLLPRIERSRLWARITSHKRYEPRSLKRFVMVAIFLFTLPSNLYILASLGVTAIQHPYPFYHEQAEVEAVDWLAAHTSDDDTVFTTYWTGSHIAARAGNRVFLGHWAETMNYAQKMDEARAFFGQASDEWRKELLRDYNISYLFYGPRERALSGFEPEGKSYLRESYSNRLVTIYRVVISEGG
jgi:hypothetical protein